VRNGSNVTMMASKSQSGRWKAMDAGMDTSDDQQDISRGRDMVDSLFQGGQGMGGTHNSILSSADYLSNAGRTLGNIEEGYYIAPAFLDKLSIHVAKNFLDLPKIKVPLILGIWGGKGQGEWAEWQQGRVEGGSQACESTDTAAGAAWAVNQQLLQGEGKPTAVCNSQRRGS
jgi:hypothetical protein